MKQISFILDDRHPPLILTNADGMTTSSYSAKPWPQSRFEFYRFIHQLRRWSGLKPKRLK